MAPRFGGAPNCARCQKAVYMAEQVIGPGGAYHKTCLTCKECNKRLDSTTLAEREGEAYCKVCHSRLFAVTKGYGFAGGAAFLSTEDKTPKEILEMKKHELSSPSLPPRMNINNSTPNLPPRPSNFELQQPSSSTGIVNSNDPPPSSFWSKKTSIQQPNLPPRPSIPTTTTTTTTSTTSTSKPSYVPYQTGYVPKKLNFGVQNDICTKCGKAVYAAELALGAGNKYHKLCLKCCQCGKLLNSTNMQDRDHDLYCRGCYSKSFGPKGYGYGNLLTPEGATR
ncbi:uncharacterized protein BX664DRAFT_275302 [Halteromyces radiatus]|uniref:uncharacterized protein n=1 Tax=Halteromyces radiatus TaxID=101107 RepID=UPI00221E546F|nr:uncharacterized protein BX664DRAFT_275302 [Halteromyces radiatus]KAI8096909.1 hypothetical protein BX664DRAFT_275302 [Halteromyces radiatus]